MHAKTRKDCLRLASSALDELVIEGITTNKSLLQQVLADKNFITGDYHTHFLQDFSPEVKACSFEQAGIITILSQQ